MATIQVTPDLLRGKATELRGYKSNHDQEMTNIKNLVNNLNEIWKGDAQQAFVDKYNSMQSTFTNFSDLLEGYAALMDTAAQKLEETDQGLSGAMSSFGN